MLGFILGSSDASVVHRVRRGRKNDFALLVDRYYGMVHAIAFAHTGNTADAEEITQESFLRAYAGLDSLRDGERFRSWLGSIVRNLSRNRLKASSREVPLEHAAEPAVEFDAARAELQRLLWVCIESLDETSREVLVLHYFEHMKLRAIAELLDISPSAAAKRLQRARDTLSLDLLSRVEGKQPAASHHKARRATTAAVLGSAAAWEGTAFAAASVGVGSFAVAAVALLLAAAGAAVYVSLPRTQPTAPPPAPVQATAADAGSTGSNEESTAAAAATATPSPETTSGLPQGPGTLSIRALRSDGSPAAGAVVRVEHVDWKEREYPPLQAKAVDLTLDAEGKQTLPGIALGAYGVLAYGEDEMDVSDVHLAPEQVDSQVNLNLKPAEPFRGRVYLPDGRPAAGAIIYGHSRREEPLEELGHVLGAVLRTESDSGGGFSVPLVWPGTYRLYAQTRDGLAGLSEFTSTSDEVRITLQKPGSLQGKVVEADTGAPVPGVKVAIEGQSWRDSGIETSDADGAFSVAALRPGDYVVRADDAVMVSANANPDSTPVWAAATSEATVQVTRGAVLSGRVYNEENGEGLAGVRIDFASARDKAYSLTTDATGSYFLGALPAPANMQLIDFNSEGGFFLPPPDTRGRMVVLDAGDEVELDIPVHPAPVISGRVEPVELVAKGARVWVSGPSAFQRIETLSDGSFRAGFPPGEALAVWAEASDMTSPRQRWTPAPDADLPDVTLNLSLRRSGHVKGTVRASNNTDTQALTGARLELTPVDPAFPDTETWDLRANMEFEFLGLVPGEYWLKLQDYGWPPAEYGDPMKVTVLEGDATTRVDFIADVPPSRRVVGEVVDTQGRPIADARIALLKSGMENGGATANRRGKFTLDLREKGKYQLRVSHEAHATTLYDLAEDETRVQVTMAHCVTLTGVVLDNATRLPLPEFLISYSYDPVKTATGADGKLRLEKFDPAALGFTVKAVGYAQNYFSVENKDLAQPLEVLMAKGATLRGLLVNSAGEAVPDAAVYAGYPRELTAPTTVSNVEGRFELHDLGEGMAAVGILHPKYATLYQPMLPFEDGVEKRIVLESGGALDCTIELLGPDTDWEVQMMVGSPSTQQGMSHLPGAMVNGVMTYHGTLSKLAPAENFQLAVHLSKPGADRSTSYTYPLALVNGETTSIVKRITPPSAMLEVTLIREGGVGNSLSVWCESEDPEGTMQSAGVSPQRGVCLFPPLPPGSAHIVINGDLDGRRFLWQQQVTLADGQVTQVSIDLGVAATVELPPDYQGTYVITSDSGYAKLLARNPGDITTNNGTIFLPHVFGVKDVSLQPGDYRVAFLEEDRLEISEWAEALKDGDTIHVNAGETISLPLH